MVSLFYFLACAVGGVAACGPTHTLLTPLDLVKCRRQVQNDSKPKPSTQSVLQNIYAKEGFSGIYLGALPTAIGYSLLGACKFGFYEIFKSFLHRLGVWSLAFALPASAAAEILADVALAPWEAIKVTMQTSASYDSDRSMLETAREMRRREGWRGFFQGLYPLFGRQVPYTMAKFFLFEESVSFIYHLAGATKESYSSSQQVIISLVAGFITGLCCAIVSNPADVLVSALNSDRRVGEGLFTALRRKCKDVGLGGLWKGLSIRLVMIGTLTALQWFIYDTWKVLVGIETTGGD